MSDVVEFEAPYGNLVAAQWFAQAAQRHMHGDGTTSEQLGHVAVTMREHANLNPGALMHGKPMTLADHQNSRMITTPFRLFGCSRESDGAAAAVVTSADLGCLLIQEGFPWCVIGGLEAVGVVKRGEGGPSAAEGHIRLGGTLPVNPNGGALSEGHVSGMNHLIEAVRQLRGEVPPP